MNTMPSTLIKIPVASFRRIESPHDLGGSRTYFAVVNVNDLPESLDEWRKINVRDPRLTSGVARKISESLEDNPELFFFKNRGLTLIAESVRFDNKTNMLELELVDKNSNGLLDGGHTYKVIREFVENANEIEGGKLNAYVKLEVLEGIKNFEDVVSIVEARNTSTQVKEESIQELKNHFELIKEVLKNEPYAERIAYKEYELLEDGSPKDIDVKEILSYLICFDSEKFQSEEHPIVAYSSKSAVIKYFKENRERLLKYIPLLPEILELRDVIYAELPAAYNKTGGKFGALTGVMDLSGHSRIPHEKLAFTGVSSKYRIPSGFIYPVLASFRNLVECNEKKCNWKSDPIKLFRELDSELAVRVADPAKELRNPNKLGKDKPTWGRCYDLVDLEVLRRKL